jgi:hypothetical protein
MPAVKSVGSNGAPQRRYRMAALMGRRRGEWLTTEGAGWGAGGGGMVDFRKMHFRNNFIDIN